MSDVSETWAEDRFSPETEEEKQAKQHGGRDEEFEEANSQVDPNESARNNSVMTSAGGKRSSMYEEFKAGLESSKASIRSSLEYIGAQIQTAKELYTRHLQQKAMGALEPREVYPRMPWHDVQASVTGLVARDVASHFIQV